MKKFIYTALLATLPLHAAATSEDAETLYNRARLHLVAKKTDALSLLKKASELGHEKAQTEYPVQLWKSVSKSKDDEKTIEALREILPALLKLEDQDECAKKALNSIRSRIEKIIQELDSLEGFSETHIKWLTLAAEFGSVEAQICLFAADETSIWNAQALKTMTCFRIGDQDIIPWENDLKQYLTKLPYATPTMTLKFFKHVLVDPEGIRISAKEACRNLCATHVDDEPIAFMFLKQLEALRKEGDSDEESTQTDSDSEEKSDY